MDTSVTLIVCALFCCLLQLPMSSMPSCSGSAINFKFICHLPDFYDKDGGLAARMRCAVSWISRKSQWKQIDCLVGFVCQRAEGRGRKRREWRGCGYVIVICVVAKATLSSHRKIGRRQDISNRTYPYHER